MKDTLLPPLLPLVLFLFLFPLVRSRTHCSASARVQFSCAGIFKQYIGARNRVGIGYRTSPPGYNGCRNQFLVSLKFKNSGSGVINSATRQFPPSVTPSYEIRVVILSYYYCSASAPWACSRPTPVLVRQQLPFHSWCSYFLLSSYSFPK